MSYPYLCLKSNYFESKKYHLTPLSNDHIESIRIWRNKQKDVLRQNQNIQKTEQITYFKKNIWPQSKILKPKNILMGFFHMNKLIGYGGLVHISWENRRAEVSFLLDDSIVKQLDLYEFEFSIFLNLIRQLAFQDLKLNKIFTETFDFRKKHIEILEKNSFYIEGRLKSHVCCNGKFVDSLIHGAFNNYER